MLKVLKKVAVLVIGSIVGGGFLLGVHEVLNEMPRIIDRIDREG